MRLGCPIPFDPTPYGLRNLASPRYKNCAMFARHYYAFATPQRLPAWSNGPVAGLSGVILVRGFSVTNSLYPDQEKRTMREPEVLILKSE